MNLYSLDCSPYKLLLGLFCSRLTKSYNNESQIKVSSVLLTRQGACGNAFILAFTFIEILIGLFTEKDYGKN